jgi:hypothetical protein
MMLASSGITLQVPADVAEIYRQSSDAERQQRSMWIGAIVPGSHSRARFRLLRIVETDGDFR